MDDKIQSYLLDLFRQHFQELTPHSKTMENIAPDYVKLNSKFYKNNVSVARVTASEAKDTPQEKNTISEDHSLFSTDSEFGKTDGSYDSDPNKQQDVSSKKKEREDKSKCTRGNQTSDDSHYDKDGEDEDISAARIYTQPMP